MKSICYFTGSLLFLTSVSFAESLPVPSEMTPPTPTTAVAVQSVSSDKEMALVKSVYGVRLAENTEPALPEPRLPEQPIAIGTQEPLAPPKETKNTVDVYLSGGAGFADVNTNGTIHGELRSITTYNASSSHFNGVYGGSADYTFTHVHGKPIDLSLGVGYLATTTTQVNESSSTTNASGSIPPISIPYQYDIASKAVLFEQRAKYDSEKHPDWHPYIITGIGPSWNSMSNYGGFNGIFEDAVFATRRGSLSAVPANKATEPFASQTTNSWAYEAGVGIEHPFSQYIAFTTDYRYINFGKAQLGGLSLSPQITDRISASSIGENTIMLSLKASFTT